MIVEIIPCLSDNYSYVIREKETNTVSLVDPSEFEACDKVINKYKIGNVNKPLFYYRQHRNSLTKKTSKIIQTKQLIFREFNKKKVNNICFFPIRKLRSNFVPPGRISRTIRNYFLFIDSKGK